MLRELTGTIKCKNSLVNLNLTLMGGQSFRWKKLPPKSKEEPIKFLGVFKEYLWLLYQPISSDSQLDYKVFYNNKIILTNNYFDDLLKSYFRLDFDFEKYFIEWKNSHKHFEETAIKIQSVRVLDQDIFENIISFICSQNNNITRISYMVEWFCKNYGNKICEFDGTDYYNFPKLETFKDIPTDKLELCLRENKFGYRAKMIAGAIRKINDNGGLLWLEEFRIMNYDKARIELQKIPGIGAKVADCICLMSLNHLESVPIDRHIYKIAQLHYMPEIKNAKLTPKQYENVTAMYRKVYGKYAGWAQAVLFCSRIFKDV